MRKNLITLSIVAFNFFAFSQTYTSQPNEAFGIDASVGYHDNFGTDNNNYGTDTYLKAFCIPGANGGRNSNRGLIRFDLSSIPTNVEILSSEITLFGAGYINSSLPGHFGNNQLKVSKIEQSWSESTVTWNTEPNLSATDFILFASSSTTDQNYAINITDWTADYVLNPSSNFGIHLGLVTEDPNTPGALVFFASSGSTAAKRPKIVVTYRTNDNDTVCFSSGIEYPDVDASLGYHDNYGTENNNYATDIYLKAYDLPGQSGGENLNRALIKFDLTAIPVNADVSSATLKLYGSGYINSTLTGHFGNNVAVLQKVLNDWNIGTVNWNSQPAVSGSNTVNVPASTAFDQDYSINILSLVQDMVASPSTNYGMLLKLVMEDPNNASALAFHSSNSSNSAKRPELCVEYKQSNVGTVSYFTEETSVTIFPNPTNEFLHIKVENIDLKDLEVIDLNGKGVSIKFNEVSIGNYRADISSFVSGTYFVTIISQTGDSSSYKVQIIH